ncbi:MAG: dihydroorotase [Pseudomonadota bacterium]|nr:dihydroorotase [Pseudomonadota bacterium]
MSIFIRGGRLVDPASERDGTHDLYLADGRIAGIDSPPTGFKAEQTIDAAGLVVCPGLVDLCARLREPGAEHIATIASETRAAAAGGITHLICPPDTRPVIDTPAMARMVRDRAAEMGLARVHPLGALTVGLEGNRLTDMAMLTDAGCVGVSNALAPLENSLVLRRAMQYAAGFDIPVFLYPQDPWLQGNGCVHEGEISTRLGLPAIPEAAETVGVARDLALIETSGARAHFHLISCGRALEMIEEAERRELPVTAGVAVHNLHLTENDIGAFDTLYKVLPPLRSAADREALRRGVASGSISAICSDHQPHGADAKLAPFGEAAPGISGLETLLPLTLRLVREELLTLPRAIAALTSNPAQIAGLEAGRIAIGDPADLCIFDPDAQWTLTEEDMLSRGRNTPFLGSELTGRVMCTLVDGRIVHSRISP